MSELTGNRAPGWFGLVAVLALLWELVGVYFYLVHVGIVPGPEASEAERAIGEAMPSWATAGFAISVLAGALGALALVLRKAWARSLLILSLVALLVEQAWLWLMSGALQSVGLSSMSLHLVVIAVQVLLVWLADKGVKRGWLS